MTAFEQLHPALQHHIVNSLGWGELREVQSLSIEAFLTGANLVILAPTAGGKTESAFFPVISRMLTEGWDGLSVLYVSPIRALLNNQEQRLQNYFSLVGRRAACWHGDTTQGERRRILADPPDCLLTTPESLEAILVSTRIDHREFFKNVRCVVIDELHAFAGDDRGWHLLSVFSRIRRLADRDLQRVGLSATVGNPDEMLTWLSAGSKRERRVVSPPPASRQAPDVQLDYVGSLDNAAKVISLLHRGEKRLVFCDSRSRVERLALLLRERGVDTFVSHSSLGLDERRAAEEAFAQKQNCVIVATSSLELGLDVGDLDRVIQIDAPATVSSFLQRMGRTGRRAGGRSNCLFLATSDEGLLRAAALLDLWGRGFVEPVNAPPKPFHILAQQLMALVLQERGVGRRTFSEWLLDVPAFAAMPDEQVGALVDHLVLTGTLFDDAGVLSFGVEGEAEYGRKNFLELLSVFTSPPLFRVMSGQKELGNVHESTFYKRQEGPVILVLAGRSWKTNHLDWNRRIAHVEPTDEKGRSRWIGEGQFLGFRVCQAIRRVLATEANEPNWSQRATAQIGEVRMEYPWATSDRTTLVQQPNGEVQWWTFAGGLANTLVADRLGGGTKAKADNLCLRFPSSLKLADVERLIDSRIRDEIVPVPGPEAIDNLKFGECLPPSIAGAVFAARFNDPEAIEAIRRERMRVIVAGERSEKA
ncbi:DEAD/DEAH box helicase [Limnoglobus roseus]|uniref:ATP-dependent helicase n=1 Tax=Limnoglobus roseus TaxID=2598579 RepID=A0A5C1AJE1_9BACT|nr:DEAD/DEAH box helicase [Limnoglobus roseus]QEL17822.1 ATP-dependent helicase [Limnoglobus roseus]